MGREKSLHSNEFASFIEYTRKDILQLSIPQFGELMKFNLRSEESEGAMKNFERHLQTLESTSKNVRIDVLKILLNNIGIDFNLETRFMRTALNLAKDMAKIKRDSMLSLNDYSELLFSPISPLSKNEDLAKYIQCLPIYGVIDYMDIEENIPVLAKHSRNYFIVLSYVLYKDEIIPASERRYTGKESGVQLLAKQIGEFVAMAYSLYKKYAIDKSGEEIFIRTQNRINYLLSLETEVDASHNKEAQEQQFYKICVRLSMCIDILLNQFLKLILIELQKMDDPQHPAIRQTLDTIVQDTKSSITQFYSYISDEPNDNAVRSNISAYDFLATVSIITKCWDPPRSLFHKKANTVE